MVPDALWFEKLLDIDFPGFTWEERFIIVSTYYDFEKPQDIGTRNYVAHPEQWCAMIKVPGEILRRGLAGTFPSIQRRIRRACP